MGKKILRIISGVMLAVAIVFFAYAIMHPEGGSVFYLFNQPIGSEIWRAFYVLYLAVMLSLFIASFFVGEKKNKR